MGGVRAGQSAHGVGDRHRLHAHAHDAGEEVDHRFLVVCEAVCVEQPRDGGVARGLLLVLIEHPVDGGAVAEAVGPGGGGNAGQLRLAVHPHRADVGERLELGGSGFLARRVDAGQRPGFGCLVAEMEVE